MRTLTCPRCSASHRRKACSGGQRAMRARGAPRTGRRGRQTRRLAADPARSTTPRTRPATWLVRERLRERTAAQYALDAEIRTVPDLGRHGLDHRAAGRSSLHDSRPVAVADPRGSHGADALSCRDRGRDGLVLRLGFRPLWPVRPLRDSDDRPRHPGRPLAGHQSPSDAVQAGANTSALAEIDLLAREPVTNLRERGLASRTLDARQSPLSPV